MTSTNDIVEFLVWLHSDETIGPQTKLSSFIHDDLDLFEDLMSIEDLCGHELDSTEFASLIKSGMTVGDIVGWVKLTHL